MQEISESRHEERNYGIDLLRLVSMYMVVILHVLAESGVLSAQSLATQRVAWFLGTIAYCAVNCFGMISGYVSYRETEKPYRYSRFLYLWVPVFFYSFGITLLAYVLKPGAVGDKELLLSAIPVTSGVYWYVSAYAGLFFLIPWLNAALRALDDKRCSKFIFILFAVFICYGNLSRHFYDGFYLNDGYSLIWLMILYLIGAWMKKCDIPSRVKGNNLILGFLISTVFSWFMKEFMEEEIFVNYVSLTILFNAFALVCVFSKAKITSSAKKLPVTFKV